MITLDPRTHIIRDEDRLETHYIKTFGLTSAIAIGGIRIHTSLANQRSVIKNALSQAQKQYEKTLSLFNHVDSHQYTDPDYEPIITWDTDDRYDPIKEWQEAFDEHATPYGGHSIDQFRDINSLYGADIEHIIDSIDTINQRITGNKQTPHELSETLARQHTVNTLAAIEKEYPGISAFLDKAKRQVNVTISKIDRIGTQYRIHIHDGTKREILELPQFKSGVVNWKGANYKPRPSAELGPGIIKINSFGFNVMSRLDEQITFIKGTSPGSQLKRMVDNIVSINLGKYVDNGHIIKHLLTDEFIFDNLSKQFGTPSPARDEILARLPQIIERSKIYMQVGGKKGLVDVKDAFGPRISKGSIRSISEPSFMKFAGTSEIPFGLWPFTSWGKVSQARANYMAGKTLKQPLKMKDIAARLGPTAKDVLEHLHTTMFQDIPGKMTNTGFYMGNGEIKSIGKGGGLWVSRFMGNSDGSLSNQLNISQYTGVYKRKYSIPLFTTQGYHVEDTVVNMNSETRKLLETWQQGTGDIILKEGTILGETGSKDVIRIENNAKVTHIQYDRGYLDIQVDEEIPLHQGSKFDQGKAMIQRLTMYQDIHTHMPLLNNDGRFLAHIISQNQSAELGLELLMNQDMAKKYHGGALGWGIIQKTMSDLVQLKKQQVITELKRDGRMHHETIKAEMHKASKELRELLKTTFGADIDNYIEEISIHPNNNEPVVILKPLKHVSDATTAHAAFARVIDIEKAIHDAQNGDWTGLTQLENRLQKHFKNLGLPQYKMTVTIPENITDYTKLADTTYSPTFVRSIHHDKGKTLERLVYFSARTPMMVHQTGAYEYMSFAHFQRSKAGYLGGFKATIDHIENAHAAGLKHYVQYLHMLMDYNVDYIRDKMFATEKRLFTNAPKDTTGNFVKMDSVRTITLSDDLINRLAEYRVSDDSLKAAGRWRVLSKELSGLQGLVDDETYSELVNTRILNFDDIRSTTKAGMGRFSVDVTDKNLVYDLVSLVNGTTKNEAVYLELPESVSINGVEARYVPIHKFDKADMFELLAERSPDGMWLGERMTRKFYTGGAFYSNQMFFLKQIGQIKKELSLFKNHQEKTAGLREELKIAVHAYYDNLKRLTKGKFSSIRNAIFEHRMPFSTRGIINSLDNTIRGLSTIDGIPTDAVYMHEDDITKLITGGKVKSQKHARAVVDYVDKIKTIQKRVKGLPLDALENTSSNELLEIATYTARTLQNIDSDELDTIRSNQVDTIKRTSGYIRKTIGKGNKPLKKDTVSSLRKLVKDIHHISAQETAIGSQAKDSAAIYRFAINRLQEMKEGTLELGGKLVGSPELSQLSMDHFKLRVIQSHEFSQQVMNKKMKDYVKGHSQFFKKFEGRIYASKEMVEAMSRDFDFDPISFIVTTLDVLDKQDQELQGFSILKEAGIFGKSGNAAKMQIFHELTQETLIENILSRLAIVEDTAGKPVKDILKPASPTAVTTMHALAEAIQDNRHIETDLRTYVKHAIKNMYGDNGLGELKAAYGITTTNEDIIVQKVIDKVKQFRGTTFNPANLRVIEGVLPDEGVRVEAKTASAHRPTDWHTFSRKYPDLLREKMGLAYTEDELLVRDTLLSLHKDIHQQYQNYVIEDSDRFRLIKEQTPVAYNHAKALFSLSYGYVRDNEQKEFLIQLADKVLSQNTISSKHGTPQVLPDLVKTLKELSNTDSLVLEKTLNNLAQGNMNITVSDKERKEMKRLGYKIEDIDFNMYEEYLNKREAYLAELSSIHRKSLQDIAATYEGTQLDTQLADTYRRTIHANIEKSSALKHYGTIPDIFYDDMVVSNELRIARESIENAKKFRDVMTMGKDHSLLKKQWKQLASTLKEYSHIHGKSVFEDPALKAFRSFEGGATDMYEIMYNSVFSKIDHIKPDTNDHIITVRNTTESWVSRMAAIISGKQQKDITITPVRLEERKMHQKLLASKETRVIQHTYAKRIAHESSVFRSGSILNSLRGNINTATHSIHDDALMKKAGKTKTGQLLLGLFTGTIIGQTLNQVVNGYSVPDLKGTVGLGGEYYENRIGIIGRESEVMLTPKPPKITPGYQEEERFYKDAVSLHSMASAYNSRVSTKQLATSFKGSIVK